MDRPIPKRSWTPSRILALAGAAGLVVLTGYLFFGRGGETRLEVDPSRLSLTQVRVAEFQEYIPITGNVLPHTTVYLDLEEGGIVEHVHVRGGVWVEKGDLILSFSNAAAQKQNIDSESRLLDNLNQLRVSKFDLTQQTLLRQEQRLDLDYQIADLRKTFERYERLMANPNAQLSRETYEETRDKLAYLEEKRSLLDERIRQETVLREQQEKQINDSIERVNRSLEVLARIIDSLEVRAPISGHLSSMNAEVGQNFQRGQRIGQVDQLDSFKIRADVDQYYISKVAVGQSGAFDFNGSRYELEISKIYPEVINNSFQMDLEFVGDAPQGIKRGQSLQIDLSLSESGRATLVNKGGFYRHTSGRWVYKVAEDGKTANRVAIMPGRQNPQAFEVLNGLSEGDWIISSGYDIFKDAEQLIFTEAVRR
jgi:HlyD family secretion protein